MNSIYRNQGKLTHARAILSIVSGLTAGILNLQSLHGIFFYLASFLSLSVLVAIKQHLVKTKAFTGYSWMYQCILDDMPSFILFWVLGVSLVHVY